MLVLKLRRSFEYLPFIAHEIDIIAKLIFSHFIDVGIVFIASNALFTVAKLITKIV